MFNSKNTQKLRISSASLKKWLKAAFCICRTQKTKSVIDNFNTKGLHSNIWSGMFSYLEAWVKVESCYTLDWCMLF